MKLTINGKEINVTLRMGAYLTYERLYGKDFSEEKVSDTAFLRLMHAAYRNECELSHETGVSEEEFFSSISQDDFLSFYEAEVIPQLKKNMKFQQRVKTLLSE